MKRKNRLSIILAFLLAIAMSLAFMPGMAFASSLIPSDFDDLDPLLPPVPPGKDPPTEPPIEIPVPDDGEDLDLDLGAGKMAELLKGGVWTISVNAISSGPFEQTPDWLNTIKMSFVADKSGGGDMYGTYQARAAYIWNVDSISTPDLPTQSMLFESDNFTIELEPYVDDDDNLGSLVPSSVDPDDPNTLLPLVPSKGKWEDKMTGSYTVLADPFDAMTNIESQNISVKLLVAGNGNVKMSLPSISLVNGVHEFKGRLSRSIDGRGLS